MGLATRTVMRDLPAVVLTAAQRFGLRLAKVRKLVGESRAQLAAAIERDPSTVHRWETGTDDPSGSAVLQLLRHYAAYADYLVNGSHNSIPEPIELNPVLAHFLTTPMGREAKRHGLDRVLASVQFRNTPTLQVYTSLTLVLLPTTPGD